MSKVLLGEIPRKKPSDDINPTFKGYQTVMEVLKIQSRFWPFLTAKYDQIQLKWASAIYQKSKSFSCFTLKIFYFLKV